MKQAPKWKTCIVVWLAIYPTITVLQYLLKDFLQSFPLPVKTLFLSVIVVPLMIFVLLPFLTKVFSRWLNKH